MSVIATSDLLVERSEFSRTWGAAPSAGIDLEPDGPTQPLVNITIRHCDFNDNDGNG